MLTSPWNTGNCTVCWLSATVVKVRFLIVGTYHLGQRVSRALVVAFTHRFVIVKVRNENRPRRDTYSLTSGDNLEGSQQCAQ